ncbi:hypothetical protein CO675_30830 [Bradyrhizobium sp. C9]|nr:hypothetical protein CO675_30830 [Bradyrhizobium sp. C9]
MESISDGHLLSRVLLTLAAIGYGFVTIKADFNRTHATNPLWTPHARFHVVWQVLSYTGIAVIALCLIWLSGPLAKERLWLAGALGAAVYGAFFVTLLARKLFGGALHDQNGYLPFRSPIGPWLWDANVTAFSVLSAILMIGILVV